MIPRRSLTCSVCATITGVVVLAGVIQAQQQPPPDPEVIDIWTMARQADFIFKGKVVEVQFRNSEFVQAADPTGKPVFDEDGNPIYEDGSNLPHSFVAYHIERIYKGKPPVQSPGRVVLQKVGGPDATKPGEIVFVPHYPHMDPGDQDVLFVLGNTFRPCPLVRSEIGRFRILADPDDGKLKIYNDTGFEVLHVRNLQMRDEIGIGQYRYFKEVTTYHFGDCDGCTLELHLDESFDEAKPLPWTPPGPQFTEEAFDGFLTYVVAQTHTPEELDKLPPVVSADISRPFFAASYSDDAPPDIPEQSVAYPRPWLDELPAETKEAILEAERLELLLLEQTGGDPVLPSTECEKRILAEGAIPGDISGPNGRPDCYINLYDLAAMAEFWLQCYDPENSTCDEFVPVSD
jgi:hypothetical protein